MTFNIGRQIRVPYIESETIFASKSWLVSIAPGGSVQANKLIKYWLKIFNRHLYSSDCINIFFQTKGALGGVLVPRRGGLYRALGTQWIIHMGWFNSTRKLNLSCTQWGPKRCLTLSEQDETHRPLCGERDGAIWVRFFFCLTPPPLSLTSAQLDGDPGHTRSSASWKEAIDLFNFTESHTHTTK